MALFKAAGTGNLEFAKALIQLGADVNIKQDNFTPLLLALKNGHWDMALLLLKNGAQINFEDEEYAKQNIFPVTSSFFSWKIGINENSDTKRDPCECSKFFRRYST